MTATVEQVLSVLQGLALTHANEDEMQRGIADALSAAGIDFVREQVVGSHGRIDFAVGRIGIECKVAGPATRVYLQVAGYLDSGEFDAIVLATTRRAHAAIDYIAPRGCPIRVVVFDGGLR
jgi:hypothetical protein